MATGANASFKELDVDTNWVDLIKEKNSSGKIEILNYSFATSVLSESVNLQFDTEGRILLTDKLLKHANIKNSILFVGLGKTFQIWNPKAFDKFKVQAKKNELKLRSKLKWDNKQKGEYKDEY